jgi:repressor LexA
MKYRDLLARYLTGAGLNANQAALRCTERGCKIHRTYLSKILNGRLPPPSAEVSRALAEVCGQDPEPLVIAGYEEKAPAPVRRLLAQRRVEGTDQLPEQAPGGSRARIARAAEAAAQAAGDLLEGVAFLPALGLVPAGQPVLSEENSEGPVAVPERLAEGAQFALRIEGDSMIEAGIEDGDYVIVRRQPTAENGEIVVARVERGEVTCKRFERHGQGVRLLPANVRYKPILPTELELIGVVKAVVKRV